MLRVPAPYPMFSMRILAGENLASVATIAAPVGVMLSPTGRFAPDMRTGRLLLLMIDIVAGAIEAPLPWLLDDIPWEAGNAEAYRVSISRMRRPITAAAISISVSSVPSSWRCDSPSVVLWASASATLRQSKMARILARSVSGNALLSMQVSKSCQPNLRLVSFAKATSVWAAKTAPREVWDSFNVNGSGTILASSVSSFWRDNPTSNIAEMSMSPLMPPMMSRYAIRVMN